MQIQSSHAKFTNMQNVIQKLQSTNEALSRTSDQQSRENDALQTDLSEAEVRITDEQERQSILQKKFEELNHLYTHVSDEVQTHKRQITLLQNQIQSDEHTIQHFSSAHQSAIRRQQMTDSAVSGTEQQIEALQEELVKSKAEATVLRRQCTQLQVESESLRSEVVRWQDISQRISDRPMPSMLPMEMSTARFAPPPPPTLPRNSFDADGMLESNYEPGSYDPPQNHNLPEGSSGERREKPGGGGKKKGKSLAELFDQTGNGAVPKVRPRFESDATPFATDSLQKSNGYKQVQTFEQELMSVNIERDCLTSEMNKLANKPNRQQRGRLRKAEIEASLEHLDQRAATLRSKIKRSPGPRDPNQRS